MRERENERRTRTGGMDGVREERCETEREYVKRWRRGGVS